MTIGDLLTSILLAVGLATLILIFIGLREWMWYLRKKD